ncbi:MAG TPA: cupin domain-containing protein [Longimicrobiales bacterium]
MKQLSSWPAPRADRHATAMLQDVPGCRLVAFTLAAGQIVPVHTSGSTVIVTVVEGNGVFSGANGEISLRVGESAGYEPNEPHGMTAGDAGLRFLAVITPSPSSAG